MVVLTRMSESARAGSAARLTEPCRQLSQLTSTCVIFRGKSPAWRDLDATFPSHFAMSSQLVSISGLDNPTKLQLANLKCPSGFDLANQFK